MTDVGASLPLLSTEEWDRLPDDALAPDEWDQLYARELDAMAEETYVPPGPRERPPPPEPRVRWRPPAREYDRQLAVLTPDGAGEFLRACRASAGMSQRQLAEAARVPCSTVARIESGRSGDVRLSTIARLAQACDVMLVGTAASYVCGAEVPLVESDHAQRHRDRGDRLLPAHLVNFVRIPKEEQFMPRHDRPYTRRAYAMEPICDVPDD